ncbi:MAG: pilus assembly protein Flp/PilA [Burkholderiales bacterium]|jgi:pilus assembly protein Flp/PilA
MSAHIFAGIKRFIRDEEGAAAVEYGLLAALIAVVIVVAVSAVGSHVCQTFVTIARRLGGGANVNCAATLS